ncbi:MAG: hypothetical protein SPI06_01920 [Terrisporobacter sp.]|uniref:hypothetical protein n=1 Tax=Terrisporobacter sp. TaxID=1965305 RepID=UPI002A912519|nr:hypothetical protein [Terrisporobacter sp.]MDY6152145.1 hypothetical protein [Terrisporobacter sp.]
MIREEAKELIPIIQAYAEGKTIQYYDSLIDIADWEDCENPNFKNSTYNFRIKPEPIYRPFANTKECWQEMKKHQPFGWVKSKKATRDVYFIITELTNSTRGVMLNSSGGWSFPDYLIIILLLMELHLV